MFYLKSIKCFVIAGAILVAKFGYASAPSVAAVSTHSYPLFLQQDLQSACSGQTSQTTCLEADSEYGDYFCAALCDKGSSRQSSVAEVQVVVTQEVIPADIKQGLQNNCESGVIKGSVKTLVINQKYFGAALCVLNNSVGKAESSRSPRAEKPTRAKSQQVASSRFEILDDIAPRWAPQMAEDFLSEGLAVTLVPTRLIGDKVQIGSNFSKDKVTMEFRANNLDHAVSIIATQGLKDSPFYKNWTPTFRKTGLESLDGIWTELQGTNFVLIYMQNGKFTVEAAQ